MSQLPQLTVVVVGGGIAGLTAAIYLTRFELSVLVLDSATQFMPVGAGLQLPPNAVRVLHDLGVLDRIKACSTQPERVLIRSFRDGAILGELPFGRAVEADYGFPYLLVHRADLHRILLDKVHALNISVRMGAEIRSIHVQADTKAPSTAEEDRLQENQERGPVIVTLTDGTSIHGDFCIGADGDRSFCRSVILGDDQPLTGSGDLVYRVAVDLKKHVEAEPDGGKSKDGLVTTERADIEELVDSSNINYWMGPDAHVVTYGLRSDQILNIVMTASQKDDPTTYGMQLCDKSTIQQLYTGWDSRLWAMVQHANTTPSKWSLLQPKTSDEWPYGDKSSRILLIGDAAHVIQPYLAQGAAQAFEDAATLSYLLRDYSGGSRGRASTVLEEYQRLRRPRVRIITQRSFEMRTVFGMPDGPQQQLRDQRILSDLQCVGSDIVLADPNFRDWLWGHDAIPRSGKNGVKT